MRVGVNTYIVQEISGKGFPIDELKVEVLELNFDDTPVLTKKGINWEILKKLSGLDVEFTLHAPTADGKNINIDLGRYSRMNIITMKNVFKVANRLNAKIVVLHGGNIKESYHRAFINTRKQIMEIASMAEDYDVRLLIENLTDVSIGTFPHELLSLMGNNVSMCLDIGHAFLTAIKWGLPLDEFILLSPYVEELHVHDNHGNFDEHLLPGEGMIGWNYVEKFIKSTRPKYLILEIKQFSSMEAVINAIQRVKKNIRG
ncbi:sugar phosphate isomerase/epimerase family protein [Thermococcus litoralis]|uniref:sugar phosphate isomerase/epimerase family protein n=1 Tax=Thermococcus litoralis TaxID=2265 RepID=UPI000B35114C|nr:sugar phosphate isomerase/epimerase family protein [Thermococcus litoralis]